MDRVELYSGGFPVTTTTFNFLQDAYGKAIKALTALGGDTLILEGVKVVGSNVTDGAIVYNGEYLPFIKGTFNSTVSIYEDVQQVPYNQDADNDGDLDLKRAYVQRYAKCGTGGLASFDFSLLKRFTPLTQLSMPVGLISMWSGAIANIPQGWALCDGANGTPNLKDRFIVGAAGAYNVGSTGGKNQVTLSESQMPSHNHSGNTSNGGRHKHTGYTNSNGSHLHNYRDGYFIEEFTSEQDKFSSFGSEYQGTNFHGNHGLDRNNQYIWYKNRQTERKGTHSHSLNMQNAGSHNHSFTTNNKGSGLAHENRPPYYALAFIMFKGL